MLQSRDRRFVPPSPEIEERVQWLIDRMTLSEKILMLGGKPGTGSIHGVERLGIPELRLADGPLGVHWWCDASTAYPAFIAAAASWDPALWYRLGQAIGRDCRARGVHVLLAPGVNIYRSPLCSRNFEYAGEDPFLSAQVGVQYIRGVQDQGVSATVKHFACNFQEYERHHTSSDVDVRTLREIYLPAFEAAVKEAGVGALMTAYNRLNGVQCSEHAGLLNGTLKGEWGFLGLVMSDWISTYSAVAAANAGLDLEMPRAEWLNEEHLVPALARGEVTEATLDDKVRRLLRLAACFGWLDHEQRDPAIPLDDPVAREVALDVARAGIVLLKNDALLPFSRHEIRRLAVLGFGAHPAVISGGGSALTTPFHATSVLDGLRDLCGRELELVHVRGPEATEDSEVYGASVFESEHGPGLWAEYFNNNDLSGAPALRRLDPQVNFFWGKQAPSPEITTKQYSVRWRGGLRPRQSGPHAFYSRCRNGHYRVLIDGQPVIDTWERERNGMHVVESTLTAGRRYEVSIEWRKTRVTGNMKFGWCHRDGHVKELEQCVAAARDADAAILCLGFDAIGESEGYDRNFGLTEAQEKMLLAVVQAQPASVVVLTAGGNVDMSRWIDSVRGVLHAWYPGQAGGQAIAEVLFGAENPAGRLPASFEKRLEDRSSFDCYHDSDGDGRVALSDGVFTGYRGFDRSLIEPRFPFGYGLSYTTFEYSELALSSAVLSADVPLDVALTLRNVGSRAGSEVVQLYVGELEPALPRPLRELKGFQKVRLRAGESQRVHLQIGRDACRYYDAERQCWTVRPGRFQVWVGANARDLPLHQSFQVR